MDFTQHFQFTKTRLEANNGISILSRVQGKKRISFDYLHCEERSKSKREIKKRKRQLQMWIIYELLQISCRESKLRNTKNHKINILFDASHLTFHLFQLHCRVNDSSRKHNQRRSSILLCESVESHSEVLSFSFNNFSPWISRLIAENVITLPRTISSSFKLPKQLVKLTQRSN